VRFCQVNHALLLRFFPPVCVDIVNHSSLSLSFICHALRSSPASLAYDSVSIFISSTKLFALSIQDRVDVRITSARHTNMGASVYSACFLDGLWILVIFRGILVGKYIKPQGLGLRLQFVQIT
jgi:hypothetical protein